MTETRRAASPGHPSTEGGNIHISKAASLVDAPTAGGLIEVRTAGRPVRAESSGGAITVAAARSVYCETAIKPRSAQGSMRASTAFGNVFAGLPSGARLEDSFLNTGSGDIVALPPSNPAVTIRAQNESAGAGRILSGFPEICVAGMPLAGSRPSVAQGSLNGGGPLFRLAVSGRVVYLRHYTKP